MPFLRLFGIFLSLVLGAAQAEVKQVAPGNETLATAVTNAVAGDVLELLTGNYSGTTVTIDKQLTLRAASASDDPVLLLPLSLTADGIRLQDLNFNGTSITSSADVVIAGNALVNTAVTANNSLASLTFIDNTMEQKVFSPRGEVNFIGNTFTNVVIQGSPTTARVLGNVFNATEAERQIALGGSEVAIIGNEFAVVGRGNTLDANITCSPSADCLVIGNRISYEGQFTSPTFVPRILNANGSRVFVRNNLIKMTSATGNDAAGLNAIRIDRTGVFIDISNNIIDFGGFAIGNDPDVAENGAIHVEDSATVQGNILVGIQRPTFTFDPRAVANQFLANLCSNTLIACPDVDGNLNADPLFVNTTDYVLGAGSPAIDAGPNNPFLIDIDGSPADLGIYGGSFPIDAFDDQRDPAATGPYVYPMFEIVNDVNAVGELQLKIFSAARHQ